MKKSFEIQIIIIAAVEILYNILYRLFSQELLKVNIGYEMNYQSLCKMTKLIHAIDYIENGNPTNEEIIKIIQYYENL